MNDRPAAYKAIRKAIYLAMQLQDFGSWQRLPGEDETYFVTSSEQVEDFGRAVDAAVAAVFAALGQFGPNEVEEAATAARAQNRKAAAEVGLCKRLEANRRGSVSKTLQMRWLRITDEVRDKIEDMVKWAEENPYHPANPTATPPGLNPMHTILIDDYYAIFSITHLEGQVLKHLSVRQADGGIPHKIAANAIADAFGFAGWDAENPLKCGDSWFVGDNEDTGYTVIAEKINKVH